MHLSLATHSRLILSPIMKSATPLLLQTNRMVLKKGISRVRDAANARHMQTVCVCDKPILEIFSPLRVVPLCYKRGLSAAGPGSLDLITGWDFRDVQAQANYD